MPHPGFLRCLLVLTLLVSAVLSSNHRLPLAQAADEMPTDLSAYYGFLPVELYKLEQRSGNLLSADLNKDGRADLVLTDNSNSRIDLLQQRDKPATDAVEKSSSVNAIKNDWRFEHRKIPVDRAIAAMVVGDFNHDGRKDIAYFAAPEYLDIRLQSESGEWAERKRFRIPEVQARQWILAAGDLNSDGRDDLAIIGKKEISLLYQSPQGELHSPKKLMNTSENLGILQIADVDADGRNDLSYLISDDPERPWGVRLQTKAGHLGPELRCEMPKSRGMIVANLDGKPGHEIAAIEATTGRVKVYQLQRPKGSVGELTGQLIQYGFGQQGSGRNRDLATGDINGDGLSDVVVTDPDAAQMLVFLQTPGQGLDQGTAYPGLLATEQVRIADLDGDKQAEVVVLSTREKTIGISRMEGGRLTFPEAVSLEKEPVAFEVAVLRKDAQPQLVVLTKERSGSSGKYELQELTWDKGESKWTSQTVRPVALSGSPERLLVLDANQDGQTDFLVLQSGERPPVFLQGQPDSKFTEPPAKKGFGLGNVSAGGIFVGEMDKPVILVAQHNFARNVKLTDKGWQVVDQFNAPESAARISGVAALDLDLQPGKEIVLVDLGVKKLRVLRKEDNVYRPWREIEIGSFPYKSTHVADLNGDGRDDLLLFGAGKFGVLYAGESEPRLLPISSFESKLEKVHFQDLIAGDLNGDGITDLAAIDTRSQMIEILQYLPGKGLRHATSFKVFEAKGLNSAEQTGTDPREGLIADVTGDGLQDLILLVHDRVLVYPQDSGKAKALAKP